MMRGFRLTHRRCWRFRRSPIRRYLRVIQDSPDVALTVQVILGYHRGVKTRDRFAYRWEGETSYA